MLKNEHVRRWARFGRLLVRFFFYLYSWRYPMLVGRGAAQRVVHCLVLPARGNRNTSAFYTCRTTPTGHDQPDLFLLLRDILYRRPSTPFIRGSW